MRSKPLKITLGWALPVIAWATLSPADVSAATAVQVAGPFVEHVSPPALCRGRTNRLELFGRELDGAIGLWTSTPGVRLAARPRGTNDAQHASFDVDVPADAPLGLFGLRLATRSGLSNVHLFLIDELPVQARHRIAATSPGSPPMKVALPAAIHSTCRAAAVDRYAIEVTAGQQVTFEVVGNRFGKNYDPLVTIRDAQGRVLVERDNDVGLFFDCRFQHAFTRGGVYNVDVRDARFAGDRTWHYVLRMGEFPVARVAVPSSVTPGTVARLQLPQVVNAPWSPGQDLKQPAPDPTPRRAASVDVTVPATAPGGWFFQEVRLEPHGLSTWLALHADRQPNQLELEPNDVRDVATEVQVPATLHGVLETAGDHDWFRFELTKGQALVVRSEARLLGSPADLELVLVDPQGREVRRVDDVTVRAGGETWSNEAGFDFSAQRDGPHDLLVHDLARDGGPAFAYRVEVTGNEPRLQLTADVARVTLPRDNFQPVPLHVTRTRFSGPVELELLGAPAGVTLEPATIPADVSEIVCRLQADRAAAEGLATVQIVGRWKSADPDKGLAVMSLAKTRPLIDQRVRDKDLRVSALRIDQLRPPPSLANRLALLITPPAPFDVQLPTRTLLITKYVDEEFPIVTTRAAGFSEPISFTAQGGQIGAEAEERSNIFLRFASATTDRPRVSGLVFNRILTRYEKFRVDVSASANAETRRVTLNRTFELEVKPAFSPAPEPASLEIEPGGTAAFRLLANRTPAFDGAVTLTPTVLSGFQYPDRFEIPVDQNHIDVMFQAAPQTPPGRYQIQMKARGIVGKYEEEVNGPRLTITIKKPPAEKKP